MKGTIGHQIASDILQKNNYGKAPDLGSKKATGAIPLPGTHRIQITPHENGMSIEHTAKSASKDPSGYDGGGKSTTNVFTDAASAHAHLGKLMGCPGCKGVGTGGGNGLAGDE